MSASFDQPADFLLPTFLILRAVLRRNEDAHVRLTNGRLYVDREEVTAPALTLSESQLKDRIRELGRRCGLLHVSPQALAQIWSVELANGERSARKLIASGQAAAFKRNAHESNLIKRWRDELLPSLAQQLQSLHAIERFGHAATHEDREQILELAPMLKDWPRQILEDPYWKFAEAPLPEMEPLALDDVWVDLFLSDPYEGFADEQFEQREEQQRWLSEPAAFVLERTYSATALIGPPGCGKTTLLKWFARQMIANPHGRFLLPLFVPLRKYARSRSDGAAGGLLEFALRQIGITHPAQVAMWTTTISYLTGGDRTRVLIMLDGWDEVPNEYRDLLIKEIDDLAYSFAILITSRPSGFPRLLPVSHFYEIASLSQHSSERLIRRWFAAANRADQAEVVLRHLDRQPDLQRLARNPFLLSLLCGSSSWWTEHSNISRTALYRQAINLIIAHHNRNHLRKITVEQRQIERLALWLQVDAPNAPRYVFDRADAQMALNETASLETVLPSRLLSQQRLDQESFHFLHTTFQEYLAARALLAEAPEKLQERIHERFYDLRWQEILSFAAGEAKDEGIKQTVWQRLAAMAQQPDRFGFIFVRLAQFVIEAGVYDGGKGLLGVDVREELWKAIGRGVELNTLVDAYADLDPLGLLNRISKHVDQVTDHAIKARYLRAAGRVRSGESSRALVETVLHGEETAAAILTHYSFHVLDTDGLNSLRAAVADEKLKTQQRVRVIRALAGAKDSTIVATLKEIALENSGAEEPLPVEAIKGLGRIGGPVASSALSELLSNTGDLKRQTLLISVLGQANDPVGRDRLIEEIVARFPDDVLVPPALESLFRNPFYEGTETIAELLKSENPKVRAAAAQAIGSSARTVYGQQLTEMALTDQDSSVRIAALESLVNHGSSQSIHHLTKIINDGSRGEDEQARALSTAMLIFARLNASRDPAVFFVLRRLMLAALQASHGALAYEAVVHAHFLGSELVERLVEICADDEASDTIREEAYRSLARILRQSPHELKSKAESVMLDSSRREPNAPSDEEEPNVNTQVRLAQAAAHALAEINPSKLLKEPGTTSRNALAAFSVRTGCLVFDDRIITAHGETVIDGVVRPPQKLRKAESEETSPMKKNKIKLLLLSANPGSTSFLKLAEEERDIKERIRASEHRDLIDIETMGAVRPVDLLEGMNRYQPHVVQFSGHGNEGEGILICDEVGEIKVIDGDALAALFRSTEKNVLLVVLNACYSQEQADAIKEVVPCVVAMKDTIGDRAARFFAASFYSALGYGNSVARAFEQGLARLKMEGSMLEGVPQSEIPVLLTRDGVNAAEVFPVSPK